MSLARVVSTLTQLEDPLPAFNFVVSLDPSDAHLPPSQAALIAVMSLGAFAEVKGLGGELEVQPYAEGGMNDFVHQLPVRHSWGRITMRRGVIRDLALWTWYQAGLNGSLGARRDGCITMLDEEGMPAVCWTFRRALATKWLGPELNALQSAVALDGIEIAHEGLDAWPLPSRRAIAGAAAAIGGALRGGR